MAEIPIPDGYGVPLVNMLTKRLPQATMDIINDDALASTKVIRQAAAQSASNASSSAADSAQSSVASQTSANEAGIQAGFKGTLDITSRAVINNLGAVFHVETTQNFIVVPLNIVLPSGRDYEITWITNDPWPTAAPGIASGAPNV